MQPPLQCHTGPILSDLDTVATSLARMAQFWLLDYKLSTDWAILFFQSNVIKYYVLTMKEEGSLMRILISPQSIASFSHLLVECCKPCLRDSVWFWLNNGRPIDNCVEMIQITKCSLDDCCNMQQRMHGEIERCNILLLLLQKC